jgi:hypothetical protein
MKAANSDLLDGKEESRSSKLTPKRVQQEQAQSDSAAQDAETQMVSTTRVAEVVANTSETGMSTSTTEKPSSASKKRSGKTKPGHGTRVLRDEHAAAIFNLKDSDQSSRAVARSFGVGDSTVLQIWDGKMYTDVTRPIANAPSVKSQGEAACCDGNGERDHVGPHDSVGSRTVVLGASDVAEVSAKADLLQNFEVKRPTAKYSDCGGRRRQEEMESEAAVDETDTAECTRKDAASITKVSRVEGAVPLDTEETSVLLSL